MPAKTLDFLGLVDYLLVAYLLVASNLSSSTHFLSPETTLPPYDEIYFLNNQFSTHV